MWTVERIDNAKTFGAIFQDWDRLASSNRMRSAVWSQVWWDSFASRYIPYVLVVRDEKGLQGIFPLALDTSTIRGRRLILIGSGKACGDDLGIMATVGKENDVVRELAVWLANAKGRNAWDCLDLDGVQPSNLLMSKFQNELQSVHEIFIETKLSENCWAVDVSFGWEQMLASMSKRMRRLVKNSMMVDYIETGRSQLKIAKSLEEAHAMLAVTEALHQSRWSERNIQGCFAVEGFHDFLSNLINQWWSSGIAYVATLELDGKPAAGVIGMWSDKELALYLVGMDINAHEHRPGWLLSIESIRLAIRSGKQRVNFLRGDEEYKARLGAKPTVQQRWIASSPRLLPRLRGAALRKGIEVRDWFRSCTSKAVGPVESSPSSADANT